MKRCTKCSEEKPESAFSLRSDTGKLRNVCKSCRSEQQMKWHNENDSPERRRTRADRQKEHRKNKPEAQRNRWLKEHHNTTLDEYNAKLLEQNFKCAIMSCTTMHADEPGFRLQVDHDHNCCPGEKSCGKCIRGLLCRLCNTMLGHGRDDPAILIDAINYLQQWDRRRKIA